MRGFETRCAKRFDPNVRPICREIRCVLKTEVTKKFRPLNHVVAMQRLCPVTNPLARRLLGECELNLDVEQIKFGSPRRVELHAACIGQRPVAKKCLEIFRPTRIAFRLLLHTRITSVNLPVRQAESPHAAHRFLLVWAWRETQRS